jgi:phenylacetate-coenzyme A ligase PaaK-like adenylate-forming protein
MIGRAMGDGSDEYALLTDNAFFEFLEPGSKDPVMAGNVEPGRSYELVLTNAAGLYRYRLGDVVRVERIENGVPIITYRYRTDETLNPGGSAVNEDDLEAAALAVEEVSGSDVRDFCAMVENDRLVLFVEPAASQAGIDALLAFPRQKLAEAADSTLRGRSTSYELARMSGTAGMPEVRVLEPETHLLYRDRKMIRERTAPDQIKPVRALDTEEKRRFFAGLTL